MLQPAGVQRLIATGGACGLAIGSILGGYARSHSMPKIGVRLPASFESAGEFLADAQSLESAGADLLLLGDGDLEPDLLLAAIAAVTVRVSLYHRAPGETLQRLARGRLIGELTGWHDVPFPADRTAWRATLAEAAEQSAAGLIIAMDPRLIDLLRNPDVEDDRTSDLQLAQG
jgi:hypothetical protein